MKLAIVTLGLALAAAQGCATTTTPTTIDPTLAAAVREGAQDRAEVLRWFGRPEDVERHRPGERCAETWYWSHPTPRTYENLAVSFDARGRVCAHAYSGPARPRQAREVVDPSLAFSRARWTARRAR
ncbi:MAG: hypothetical protein R3A52_27700 [Polyangiales bacterium]